MCVFPVLGPPSKIKSWRGGGAARLNMGSCDAVRRERNKDENAKHYCARATEDATCKFKAKRSRKAACFKSRAPVRSRQQPSRNQSSTRDSAGNEEDPGRGKEAGTLAGAGKCTCICACRHARTCCRRRANCQDKLSEEKACCVGAGTPPGYKSDASAANSAEYCAVGLCEVKGPCVRRDAVPTHHALKNTPRKSHSLAKTQIQQR